ncbi:Conserved_hypothetical protein [Hexamita inflata]|uniref:Uncharacterized protein n=1 Tax=Hexamita inflata TaxID=28002 RepID=A0AA86QRW7_9EUKA|nr:Conserved hypothetical protein [Hexamita inflata]
MVSRQTNWRTKQQLRELLKMDKQSRVDTEFSNVPVTLRQHRLANNIPSTETVPVSVQVDAVALQDNPTYSKTGEAKNVIEHVDEQVNTIIKPICYGFAFLMVPLDNKNKPQLLFMLLDDKGLNETRVPEIYEKLSEQLQQQRYHCKYMITDGDNMYTKLYSQSLTMSIINTHKKHMNIGEYKRMVKTYKNKSSVRCKMHWLHDTIHTAKNIRPRFLKHRLSLNGKQTGAVVNVSRIQHLKKFQNNSVLDSRDKFSQMDQLPLEIFNPSTLQQLMQEGLTDQNIPTFIYILINMVTQLCFIEFDTLKVLEYLLFVQEYLIRYYMYTYHDEESDKYGKCQVNNSSLTNAAIKPWTRTQVESLIIYCSALEQQISENKTFNLLSLSSYRIELYFAHLRQVCIHNHTPENVKRVIEDDYIRQYLENYLHINNKSTRQQNRTGSTFHSVEQKSVMNESATLYMLAKCCGNT